VVAALLQRADAARGDLGDRLRGVQGSGRRPPGRIGGTGTPEKVKHLAVGCGVVLGTAFAPKYSGGGADALVDGQCGSLDFHDGAWQGYEAVDVVATLDLGRVRDVTTITCRHLESQPSWIFLPRSVEISISTDGEGFEVVSRRTAEPPTLRPTPSVTEFRAGFASRPVRYVRVRAETLGVCPDWHPGAGGKPWIFTDEIIVR